MTYRQTKTHTHSKQKLGLADETVARSTTRNIFNKVGREINFHYLLEAASRASTMKNYPKSTNLVYLLGLLMSSTGSTPHVTGKTSLHLYLTLGQSKINLKVILHSVYFLIKKLLSSSVWCYQCSDNITRLHQ